MTDTMAVHDSLKAAYEDVAYVGRPNPWTHPGRLAAIGSLFGLSPPDPEGARALGARGRRRALEFSWDSQAVLTERVYEAALRLRREGRSGNAVGAQNG